MKGILWAPAGMILALLAVGCGEESPIVDAPLPSDDSKTTTGESLHLDYAWGTAMLSQIEASGDGGELTVRVQTPGRGGPDAYMAPAYVERVFAMHRLDEVAGMGVSFQIRDDHGRLLYEMGARNSSGGGILFERSGRERLDVYCSVLPDGRRQERYHFDDGTRTYEATWVEGEPRDDRFEALGTAAAGLASSSEARLLGSLLSDSRFAAWLGSSKESGGGVQTQYLPLEVELICDILDDCRREICEDNPGSPICAGCTAGSILCDFLRLLFP